MAIAQNKVILVKSKTDFPQSNPHQTSLYLSRSEFAWRVVDQSTVLADSYLGYNDAWSELSLSQIEVGGNIFETLSVSGFDSHFKLAEYFSTFARSVVEDEFGNETVTTPNINYLSVYMDLCSAGNDLAGFMSRNPTSSPIMYEQTEDAANERKFLQLIKQFENSDKGEVKHIKAVKSAMVHDGMLERSDNGAWEYPLNGVEYKSPISVGQSQVYRQYFETSNPTSTVSWVYLIPTTGITTLTDANLLLKNDGDVYWRKYATSNSRRWWYVSDDVINNQVAIEVGDQVSAIKGWIEYIK